MNLGKLKMHFINLKSLRFPILTAVVFISLLGVSLQPQLFLGSNGISASSSLQIKLCVMFLLAEPHFAMTIPLLWGYRELFKTQKLLFVYLPIAISVISLYLFFKFTVLFTLIFLIANVYHVNRQSVGFLKLQASVKNQCASVLEILLHLFALLAVLNKTFTLIDTVFESFILLMAFVMISSIAAFLKFKEEFSIKNVLVISQGFLIFFPLLIFEDVILAFAVGISIHYIQYLVISLKLSVISFRFSVTYVIAFLLIYALTTTSILSGSFGSEKISLLIFIPTLLQLLHFYFDSLIWRRTQPVIRQNLKQANI